MANVIEVFKVSDAVNDDVRDILLLHKDEKSFAVYHNLGDGNYSCIFGLFGNDGGVRLGDNLLSKAFVEKICGEELEDGYSRLFYVENNENIWLDLPKDRLVIPAKK